MCRWVHVPAALSGASSLTAGEVADVSQVFGSLALSLCRPQSPPGLGPPAEAPEARAPECLFTFAVQHWVSPAASLQQVRGGCHLWSSQPWLHLHLPTMLQTDGPSQATDVLSGAGAGGEPGTSPCEAEHLAWKERRPLEQGGALGLGQEWGLPWWVWPNAVSRVRAAASDQGACVAGSSEEGASLGPVPCLAFLEEKLGAPVLTGAPRWLGRKSVQLLILAL